MMTRSISSLLACLLAAACGSPGPRRPEDPAYRTELLERLARDQAIRDTLILSIQDSGAPSVPVIQRMMAIDSQNLLWFRSRLERDGWPAVAQVDTDGISAAFLLVQHADADPDFQERMLPQLEDAYRRGEVSGQDVALLTDRVAKARGRPQRYGTQTTIVDGRAVIDPIEDSGGVDDRRAALGLPTLATYKRFLDSILTRPTEAAAP